MRYIANYIGGILSKNNIIIKQEEPIYIYGAELILNFLAAIVTFFLISIFFNQMFNTLIFITVFCVLRGCAGGYHASSFIKCYILSVSIFIILMLLNKYLSIDFKMALVWPLFLLGQLVLVLTAPSQNLVNPKTETEMKKNRKLMFLWLCVIDTVMLMCWINSVVSWSYFTISYTLIAVAILSVINAIQYYFNLRRREFK